MEMGREVLHNFLFVNDAKIQHSAPEVKFWPTLFHALNHLLTISYVSLSLTPFG